MNLFKKLIFLPAFIIIYVSCDDLELIDTAAPSIEVKEPMMGSAISAGTYAHFEAKFVDDFELATYNIEIHENFGSHSHGRLSATADDPSLLKWSYKQSFIIPQGLTLFQVVLEDEIEVSANALAGPYHFIVQAIDKAGNSTSFQDDSAIELEVYLKNESQSIIDITNLVNGELYMEVDAVFDVQGAVTDPTTGDYAGMHSIACRLGDDDDDGSHSHGRIAEEDLLNVFYEGAELDQFMVDGMIVLEKIFSEINFVLLQQQLDDLQSEGVEHLLLVITVLDEQGNFTISKTPVHLPE